MLQEADGELSKKLKVGFLMFSSILVPTTFLPTSVLHQLVVATLIICSKYSIKSNVGEADVTEIACKS